ncbi:MAG: PAS domain-containing sensor histidine kinase, partial [bacterium]
QHEGPAALNELLPEFSKLHHIKKIRIIHPDGRISFSSETQEKGKFLQQKNFADFISTPSEVLAYYIKEGKHTNYLKWRKLVNKTRCQKCHDASQKFNGFLSVETSDEISFRTLKSDYRVIGGIALGIILLLSLATVVLFIRSVERPVHELRSTMDAIERGDFSARTKNSRRDELGQLAIGMNAMAEKLQKARNHLTEHHRQELLQAEALAKIGELAAGMAHEIKNPISGIVFAANSILREMAPKDNRREIFQEIVKQANRAEQNLEALLTFARQSRLERFPTDLNAMIERILLFVRQQPDMKFIKIESNLDKNLPEILVDPKQIEQVLLNLVINAVQAMPKGGCLNVSTKTDTVHNIVFISVQDTGVGIAKESHDEIFQPFYTTKLKGVGLGLTLCKEMVARHNGTISFESKVGRGTTFTIELPIGRLEVL